VVHRGLISSLKLEEPKTEQNLNVQTLENIGGHLSLTERRATRAEREVSEKLGIVLLEKKLGEFFSGVITGVNASGLFVKIIDYGIEGFIPRHLLIHDVFLYNQDLACYRGKRTGQTYCLFQRIKVRLDRAQSFSKTLIFSPVEEITKKNKEEKKYNFKRKEKKSYHTKKKT
jgi:ribonuclease R